MGYRTLLLLSGVLSLSQTWAGECGVGRGRALRGLAWARPRPRGKSPWALPVGSVPDLCLPPPVHLRPFWSAAAFTLPTPLPTPVSLAASSGPSALGPPTRTGEGGAGSHSSLPQVPTP